MTTQTKTALRTEIGAQYPDNTSGLIAPVNIRLVSGDSVDSWQQAPQVNAQTATAYTVIVDDYGKLITLNNASSVVVALPSATSPSFFPFNVFFKNNGVGTVTVTSPSNIDGGSLTLNTGQSAFVISNGTTWISAILSSAAAGSIVTNTTPGLVPALGGSSATNFLSQDLTWHAPAGAGNVVGTSPSVVGRLGIWNNLSATALINSGDWGLVSHALTPVNDNATDIGVIGTNRVRAVYGITYNGQTYNIQGATSGAITFNTGATVTSYTLTWPTAAPGVASGVLVSTGGAVSFGPVVQPGVTQNLTVGFTATSFPEGTVSTGTYTPAPASGNFQHYTNNGAHTLAPPSSTCTMIVDSTNGASAGIITTSGFSKVTGDALDTTSGHIFRFYISVNTSTARSHLHVTAMQ